MTLIKTDCKCSRKTQRTTITIKSSSGLSDDEIERIKSSSGLSDDEIERMVKDAEANAEADKQKEVDLRNDADALLFTVDKERIRRQSRR